MSTVGRIDEQQEELADSNPWMQSLTIAVASWVVLQPESTEAEAMETEAYVEGTEPSAATASSITTQGAVAQTTPADEDAFISL